MGIISGIVVYIMIWWTVIFMMLPWGNRQPDTHETGMAHGAPVNPNIKKKFIATTIISVVIWIVIYIIMDLQIIDFREGAREMADRLYPVSER